MRCTGTGFETGRRLGVRKAGAAPGRRPPSVRVWAVPPGVLSGGGSAGPRSAVEDLDELGARAARRKSTTVFEPDNHLLRDLSRYLVALHAGRDILPRLDGVWKRLEHSLAELGQGIEGIVMERGATGYIPKVLRHGKSWEIRELSDGYQAILVVIFDLILRYIFLFSSLSETTPW